MQCISIIKLLIIEIDHKKSILIINNVTLEIVMNNMMEVLIFKVLHFYNLEYAAFTLSFIHDLFISFH